MAAATCYSQGFFGGQAIEIPENVHLTYMHARHPGAQLRSLKVEEGFRFRVRTHVDGTGGWSQWFEAGEYSDLSKYRGHERDWKVARGDDAWVAEVVAVDYSASALATAYYDGPGESPPYHFPPGEIPDAVKDFWWFDDAFRTVEVPSGHILTLFEKPGFAGTSIELEGGVTYDLQPYRWAHRARSSRLLPDACEIIAIHYDDSGATRTPGAVSSAAAIVTNSTPLTEDGAGEIVSTHSVTIEHDLSTEETWSSDVEEGTENMLGISATESVTVKAEFAGSGVEASVSSQQDYQHTHSRSASYGKGGSVQKSQNFTADVDVTLPAGRSASVAIQFGLETVDGLVCERTWRNMRTGETFKERQKISGSTAVSVVETVTPIGAT